MSFLTQVGTRAVIALGCVLGWGCSPSSGGVPCSHLGPERALAVYGDIIQRLGMRTGEDVSPGRSDVKPKCNPVKFSEVDMADIYEIEGKVEMDMDACTGDPSAILNWVFFDRMDRTVPFKDPYDKEPAWSKEEASRRAEDLLARILGKLPKELHLEKALFEKTGSYRGNWHVIWSATCGGYPVEHGWSDIYLNEEFGLVVFRGGGYDLPVKTEVLVSEADAVIASLRYQERVLREHGDFSDVRLDQAVRKAYLKVVVPNYRYTPFLKDGKTVWGMKPPPRGQKLAWAVQRLLRELDGTAAFKFEVWIDAATGTPLGGDLYE